MPRSSTRRKRSPAGQDSPAAEDSPDVFLIYSSQDRPFALKLARDLKAAGINLWMDKLDIPIGDDWQESVQRALKEARRVLVMLSPDSVKSAEVRGEVNYALKEDALKKKKRVIPIFYRDCEVPPRWELLQRIDFRVKEHNLYADRLKELITALQKGELEGSLGQNEVATPLYSFHEVLERVQALLKEIEGSPNAELMMIVASPIIDLHEKSGRLRHTLANRIEEGGITKILCLSPHADGKPSDLFEFCRVLENDGRRSDKENSQEVKPRNDTQESKDGSKLFDRGWKEVDRFHELSTNHRSTFEIRFAAPRFHLILVKHSSGEVKVIFYVFGKRTPAEDTLSNGFYSQDSGMGQAFENLFHAVWDTAEIPPEDNRLPDQRLRDAELQQIGASRKEDGEWPEKEVAEKFGIPISLHMKVGIFPPDIALAENDFVEAIAKAADEIWGSEQSPHDRIGIDVGTGTGILALLLAEHCGLVVGTDIDQLAINNFKENARRYSEYREKEPKKFKTRFVPILCNLLEGLEYSSVPLAGKKPLIVFNHPYYSSPSNMFHVGGNKGGGAAILSDFLKQAKPFISRGGGLLLPDAELGGKSEHRPTKLALKEGYEGKVVKPVKMTRYGEHSIMLFTLNAAKASLGSKKARSAVRR